MTKITSARLGLLCAAAITVAGVPAAQAQEGVAIKNLLGQIGILPPERDPIRYRERAPLVLPPKMELRAPAGAETYAANNPQWPNDPDLAAKRKQAAEQASPVLSSEIRRMSENNPRLTIDEMRAGRNPNNKAVGRHVSDREGVWISPEELRRGERTEDAKTADAGPAVRGTLADPPSVYRKSAQGGPVREQFRAKVDQQEQDANPINWLTRQFKSKDDD